MRPYKVVIGCTQIFPALQGTEVIKFQLYSQQDYNSIKLSVQDSIEVLEQVTDGDFSYVSFTPPEVAYSKTSIPFISWYIRIPSSDLSKLLNLIKQVFKKHLYIEVQ